VIVAHIHPAVDYIELAVSDLATTRSFHEAAFGWGFNDPSGNELGSGAKAGNGERRGPRTQVRH
jgi:predicted enzyme related to lactoylglutathione lyase